jgi:hypothetical protein
VTVRELDLEQRARKVLAAAAALGEARAMNLNPSGPVSHGKTESQPPPWQGTSTLDDLYALLTRAAARGPSSLRQAVKDAEDALKAAKRYPLDKIPDQSKLEKTSFEFKWLVANSDKGVTELARLHNISRQTIYAYRRRYRFDNADDDPAYAA